MYILRVYTGTQNYNTLIARNYARRLLVYSTGNAYNALHPSTTVQ